MRHRKIIELLEICIDNFYLFEKDKSKGLCEYFNRIGLYEKMITLEEKIVLELYLYKNLPSLLQSFSRFKTFCINFFYRRREIYSCAYIWEKNQSKPRLKWLKSKLEIEKKINIVELLQICIDNFDLFEENECTGLCSYSSRLYKEDKIKFEEIEILNKYVRANIPFPFQGVNRLKQWFFNKINFGNEDANSTYFWTKKESKPRLKYLKTRIEIEKAKLFLLSIFS